MTLRNLTKCLTRVTIAGTLDVEITALTASSREVAPGLLYAAIRGTSTDGHRFIGEAIAAGVAAILAETAPPADLPPTITWLHVPDSRAALPALASEL